MQPTKINFAGEALLLDPAGALVWPSGGVLAVADLHLEKGSACARRGQLVPPWDSRLTLARLAALVGLYRPATLVLVGDSFHDNGGAARLAAEDLASLACIAASTGLVWVSGNHDPAHDPSLPGLAAPEFARGGLVFRHQAKPGGQGEISGHFHPKALVATRAASISRPCFLCSGARIILPAFGAYTGGLDVRSPALAALFPDQARIFLLGRDRLFGFALASGAVLPLSGEGATHIFA